MLERWLSSSWVLAVALALISPADARAQTDPTAEARTLAEEARRAFESEEDTRAAELFERSLAISERPSTLYNLGLSYARLGRDDEAVGCFERFLELADTSMTRAVEDATERLRELRARVCRLRLVGVPSDASVEVDGDVRLARGRWLALAPGAHVVVVRRGGAEQRFELGARPGALEDRRVSELRGEAAAATSASTASAGSPTVEATPGSATESGGPARTVLASPGEASTSAGANVVWSWALGAATLAATGAMIGLGVHTQSTYDGLRASCSGGCTSEQIAEVEGLSVATNVLIGVSAALALSTALALVFELGQSPTEESTALRVGPGSLEIEGRF